MSEAYTSINGAPVSTNIPSYDLWRLLLQNGLSYNNNLSYNDYLNYYGLGSIGNNNTQFTYSPSYDNDQFGPSALGTFNGLSFTPRVSTPDTSDDDSGGNIFLRAGRFFKGLVTPLQTKDSNSAAADAAKGNSSATGNSFTNIASTWKPYNLFKNATTTAERLGGLGGMVGAGSDLLSSFMPNKSEYDGTYGSITNTMDKAWNGISDAASMFGPWGLAVSGAMKLGNVVSKGLNAIGIGNDALTKWDSVAGSTLFSLTPVGLINNIFTKKTQSMRIDDQAFQNAGDSYTGAYNRANEAKEKSQKRYGLFSRGAYHRANDLITNAKLILERVGNITNRALKRRDLLASMSSVNSNRYNMQLHGGYKLKQVRAGKRGLALPSVDIVQGVLRAAAKLLSGGTTHAFYNAGKQEDVKLKNPYFIEYDQDGGSMLFNAPKDSAEAAALIEWYNSPQGEQFANNWVLDGTGDNYMYYPRQLEEEGTIIVPTADTGMKLNDDNKREKEEKEIDRVLMDVLDYMMENPKNEWPRFLQRLVEDPRGITFIDNNGDEVQGSHYMSNKGLYVYPEIAEVDGELRKLSPNLAWNYAQLTGNYIKFDSEKDAARFADHYKEIFPRYMSEIPVSIYDALMSSLGNPDLYGVRIIREHDGKARTEGNRIYYNANDDVEELLLYELSHYLLDQDETIALPYAEFYLLPGGLPMDDAYLLLLGADLDFVKGYYNDPSIYYSPKELIARLLFAKWYAGNDSDGWTPLFFANARLNELQYGDNFRDLLHMYDDEHLSQLFNLYESPFVQTGGVSAYQRGGAMNIIPEGALHREKHHISDHIDGLDGVTKKGIPVVSEEGGELVLLAEIERQEIIFRLEVTEKIEELYKKYYDNKTSADDKDAAAIEAGRILADEIMHNTDDRTNNII